MKKFFGIKSDNFIILDGEELKHLAVLRCQINEQILCFVGDKFEYLCEIKEITKKQAKCLILEENECSANPTKNIVLFQGLPKQDKLELITQKLTELGISKIIPFESSYTIAKPNQHKIERMVRISQEACKQCGRSIPLVVEPPIKFSKMLDLLNYYDIVLFANETNKQITDINFEHFQNIAIIVGSEGGFSAEEIQKLIDKNVTQIGLGQRILRTETASIILGGLVSYLTKN